MNARTSKHQINIIQIEPVPSAQQSHTLPCTTEAVNQSNT